jgi:hypothetical protein
MRLVEAGWGKVDWHKPVGRHCRAAPRIQANSSAVPPPARSGLTKSIWV